MNAEDLCIDLERVDEENADGLARSASGSNWSSRAMTPSGTPEESADFDAIAGLESEPMLAGTRQLGEDLRDQGATTVFTGRPWQSQAAQHAWRNDSASTAIFYLIEGVDAERLATRPPHAHEPREPAGCQSTSNEQKNDVPVRLTGRATPSPAGRSCA